MGAAFHHVELWTRDCTMVEGGWNWLMTSIGWQHDDAWNGGRSWSHRDGCYLVVEQSPDVRDETHDRRRPGLNHLALHAGTAGLEDLRGGARDQGWNELFADSYPHAGGPQHVALFLENQEGFEVEIVAPTP